jgi:hypothetical protein
MGTFLHSTSFGTLQIAMFLKAGKIIAIFPGIDIPLNGQREPKDQN